MEAEKSFLGSKANGGHRRKGRPPAMGVIKAALIKNNVEYFRYLLDDETEKEFWLLFMTGKQVIKDEQGQPIMVKMLDAEGKEHLVPQLEDVELNPISLKAFLRAVEYKRGQPVSVDPINNKIQAPVVQFEMIGASPEFFLEQGKATGLIR